MHSGVCIEENDPNAGPRDRMDPKATPPAAPADKWLEWPPMAGLLEIYSLGGCGGFGMNATLFVADGRGLLVDFGIGFPRTPLPGVSLTVPDASSIARRVPDLAAVVISHAHDDHAAGLPYLPPAWERAPVYGPGFALASAADRLDDTGTPRPRMVPVPLGGSVPLGPFEVTFIPVTHSVPDAAMLAIRTPQGLVVHTADFKLDPAPLRPPLTDTDRLRRLGDAGVRVLLVDSTGARRPGRTGSESGVAPHLDATIGAAEGQVVVSTFASHLHRIQAAVAAAHRHGRKAALLGQRMTRTVRHGTDLGLLDAPSGVIVPPEELNDEPPRRRMWLAGGCQGEPQSSLARLSSESDTRAEVGRGDTIVFSSSTVPGNEMPVARMIDRFLRLGASVITTEHVPGLHVSGHGSRDEIAEVIALLRPEIVVPVHGDRAHLEANAALAEAADPAPRQVVLVEKGDRLEIGGYGATVAERLEIYTNYLDDAGTVLSPAVLRERQQISASGIAVVQARRSPGGRVLGDAVRVEALGIPAWDSIAPQAERAARELLAGAPAWTPVADLEAELARRVGNLLRRGSRYRPRVIVMLD